MEFTTETLEHLGLVACMVDELGIVECIDEAIPQDHEQRHISIGLAAKAMILNGLGFANRQLYLLPQFFVLVAPLLRDSALLHENKPLHLLLGEGIEPSHLNDKVLGRALDALHARGIPQLFSLISAKALKALNLTPEFLHLDSTSFHVDGKYNSDEDPEPGVVHITQGFSKDHRPDLNQVMLNLIVENRHGIPVAMQPLSGNTSDKKSFEAMISSHINLIQSSLTGTIIADSALYTKANIQSFQESKIRWITRVPETITEAEQVIRDSSQETMTPCLGDPRYRYSLHQSCYGEVKQQWVLFHSEESQKRLLSTLPRKMEKLGEKEHKSIDSILSTRYACEADARAAIETLQKKLILTELHNIGILECKRYAKAGRPTGEPDFVEYQLTCTQSSSFIYFRQELHQGSCFILATNQTDPIDPEETLLAYKNQSKVESGFRFLKSPEFLADSLYLKKPERIEALLFVMTLCLLVYASLECRIRNTLKETDPFYPDQKGKPIQNPTARWVFQTFIDVALLTIGTMEQRVMNLKPYNLRLAGLLGRRYEIMYGGGEGW